MDKLFLTVVNMSLTGAFVIAVICLARLPLKKAPKTISYCLWAAAGFRLVLPFSIESAFSLIPFPARPIPPDIAMQAMPRIGGIFLPASTPTAGVNPLEDDRAIHVMGRKAVHMTLVGYDAWVAAGEDDADVYDYAERVLYTPVGKGEDGPMYMTIDDYKAWAAAGEDDADVSDFAVPYDGES